jgi:hypothetical protein
LRFFFSPSAGFVDFLAVFLSAGVAEAVALLAGALEAVEAGFFSAVVDFGGMVEVLSVCVGVVDDEV